MRAEGLRFCERRGVREFDIRTTLSEEFLHTIDGEPGRESNTAKGEVREIERETETETEEGRRSDNLLQML
jgi:hypothetical protein